MSRRPPTIAEAFFRTGFGCLAAVLFKIAVVVVIVLVVDCRLERQEREEQERRAVAATVAERLADDAAKELDSDGRFVRRPAGLLPDADPWGRPFRLGYTAGTLHDELEVRSAGPDGEWNTGDDVTARRTAKVSAKAAAREAAQGLFDAAKRAVKKAP